VKGGRRTEKRRDKRNPLNDARIAIGKGIESQGIRGTGKILKSCESGGQERYGKKENRKYKRKLVATIYTESAEGRVSVQQLGKAVRVRENRAHKRTVREGARAEQRGWRNEVVGEGTGTECSSERQDAGVTQARGLHRSRASKIIPGRLPGKSREEGGKKEALRVGRDKEDTKESRRHIRQGQCMTEIHLDTKRDQEGELTSGVRIGGTDKEQQQVRKGEKGDMTLKRQETGPMDRYVAVGASSNQTMAKGVVRKKDGTQGIHQGYYTCSHPNAEVKLLRAWLVVR
jgi:hypothetical protein